MDEKHISIVRITTTSLLSQFGVGPRTHLHRVVQIISARRQQRKGASDGWGVWTPGVPLVTARPCPF